MPTMQLAGTRSVSIAAPVATVLDFVGDPRNLPRWAPGFAPHVEPATDGTWRVGGVGRIRVDVDRDRGTVDLLPAAAGVPGGAHLRAVPNADGAELVFTVVLGQGADDDALAAQLRVIEAELRTVRELCEP